MNESVFKNEAFKNEAFNNEAFNNEAHSIKNILKKEPWLSTIGYYHPSVSSFLIHTVQLLRKIAVLSLNKQRIKSASLTFGWYLSMHSEYAELFTCIKDDVLYI